MGRTNCITIPSLGPPSSAASSYFKRTCPESSNHASNSSNLLKSIRAALQGSRKEANPPFYRELLAGADDQSYGEEELAWNQDTVIWSAGGVQGRKWSFEEGQHIQWACIGWLLQPGMVHSGFANSAARYTSDQHDEPNSSTQDAEGDTFSPFTRIKQKRQKTVEHASLSRGVFVFLRNFGKILLVNGMEHIFALPFVVRQAWPLYPHGVLIQRVLDRAEAEEAEITGDFTLPTLFTITNPFSEPRAVGLTEGIIGGIGPIPPTLKDNENKLNKPLKSVPADEHVIWVSNRLSLAADEVVVTINAERRKLSVWRYVHIPPKDIPVPIGRNRARSLNRKKMSMAGDIPPSSVAQELANRADRMMPLSPETLEPTQPVDFPDIPPLSSLPGMPSALSTAALASLASGSSLASQWSSLGTQRGRRGSLTRNELSMTMDRMVLGRRADDNSTAPAEHERMKAAYWMEKLFVQELTETDSPTWKQISMSIFDQRWDGDVQRSYIGICLPSSERLIILSMMQQADNTVKIVTVSQMPAISSAAIRATRDNQRDLLVVKPDNTLVLLTHGLQEIPLRLQSPNEKGQELENPDLMMVDADGDRLMASVVDSPRIVSLRDPAVTCVTVVFADGSETRTTVNFLLGALVGRCFQILSKFLPGDAFFALHKRYLEIWYTRSLSVSHGVEFECFSKAIIEIFHIESEAASDMVTSATSVGPWHALHMSKSHKRLMDDTPLLHLTLPPSRPHTPQRPHSRPPHELLGHILCVLHSFGEELRVMTHCYQDLLLVVPLICQIAHIIRPEWADYWKRVCPDAYPGWICSPALDHIDHRLHSYPMELASNLYARVSNPEMFNSSPELRKGDGIFTGPSGYAFGRVDGSNNMRELNDYYSAISDPLMKESRRRAELTVLKMVKSQRGSDYLNLLPLGYAAPLREAARTCQLGPPPDWPVSAYELVGRNDLSEGALVRGDLIFDDGYRTIKDHIHPKTPRKTFTMLFDDAHKAAHGSDEAVTGVELNLADFTGVRFGQDRRIEEVARMLCSSDVPSVKMLDRPELNEHELAKEHQNQVLRTAERTLSLPLGRAMFTFGSVPTVTREVYVVPRIELAVRLQPQNTVIAPELSKLPLESLQWAEFHSGVAAGLRISPSSGAVDSSWIAFNRPHDLTPEHAGFLFGLGLTGHLKEMLTWHTFSYLTPKHDLTSIGVLLGLSAANVGSSNRHVTKLLAVHTPALLPTQAVDLNVPLLTQAAGLVGIGLLYMGTKNRRMAEVALHQISRKDLFQPDLSNEHRESYTVAAALSFGMIMLGRGTVTSSPADVALLSRLRVLIHGEGPSRNGKPSKPTFDINLTSPAATIALGLMYLKTERQDIADILTIPDTVLALNQMQPSFLLVRTLARALIMWDAIKPDKAWLATQIPDPIAQAIGSRFQGVQVDDALELAYYNILSGCCFAIALKYAGTAREEAYLMIISYYDLFSRLTHTGTSAFDHKIKRSAIRDGLNVISLSLNMIMAGTGEINCLRRLRYAHGMYNAPIRYGSHMATHMALGLLFLGGGRFTLGTSNAAIACMVTAFYPRFPALSSDNKGHLQALRHLWVLAVEPRCLIARDVDTKEVVYLPMKIKVKEGPMNGVTQLISPTLIPGLDRLLSIKVDTPRYWPFFLDIANIPRHRQGLLRSQTLYVKRRTAFLSYMEDPKGSRSLFVRSGNSTGDAATLDFPQLTDAKAHPAGDLQHFITSFSNDTLFIAFADWLCRQDGHTDAEKLFNTFCHAALLDSIIQDKPQTLQTHLLLYRARIMSPRSRYFHLVLQDLRFAADFYSKVYERRFSGRLEAQSFYRPPLLRESTVAGALHVIDAKLAAMRDDETTGLRAAVRAYALGKDVRDDEAHPQIERVLGWYLLRHSVPSAVLLELLRQHARGARSKAVRLPPPDGTQGTEAAVGSLLEEGVSLVVHAVGLQMVSQLGLGWSVQSLEDVLEAWQGDIAP